MSVGAFSLDQLMELAGLSVSQAGLFLVSISLRYHEFDTSQVYQVHPPEKGKRVLVAVGPGNNGKYMKISVFSEY